MRARQILAVTTEADSVNNAKMLLATDDFFNVFFNKLFGDTSNI